MKLIAGLGNPGSEYEDTRHNIGFKVIDQLAKITDVKVRRAKFNAIYGKGVIAGEEVILVKPLTYINLSGQAIQPFMRFFKVAMNDLLIVYDDLDLAVGQLRLRTRGSAGGHNGMKSIIQELGSQDFKRLRVGIGRPDGRQPVIDYVLRPFPKTDIPAMTEAIERAASACQEWASTPFDQVMNRFNG
ncbi:aminoacyl-tRNA hydrolase [Camelliibacillus cellulosilyticus]|uniref:Peptidyl-tRNA hydrolase n=1 Tax=Camelliibacillus cellulosilyticus TaxID=2174486 RepID=A0ABV9GQA5_9BACL